MSTTGSKTKDRNNGLIAKMILSNYVGDVYYHRILWSVYLVFTAQISCDKDHFEESKSFQAAYVVRWDHRGNSEH